ncbi:peptidase inhibitor family I36 protein [Streptomyces sp. NPDC085639]|uniref:peptidase inhibitor family I36 protein n=1 Tax=Streptomyces sp. NPDC085639 TaxID=3365734 RepID=UPI0037D82B3D
MSMILDSALSPTVHGQRVVRPPRAADLCGYASACPVDPTSGQVHLSAPDPRWVDGYLAEEGGKQVAANRIELDSRGFLLLALPGETYARDLAAPVGTRGAAAACPYTYVCAYSQENFKGDFKALFTCNTLNPIPWTGTGSWKNHQRAELRARFYDSAGNVGWTSPGGYRKDAHAPWGWVYWLSPPAGPSLGAVRQLIGCARPVSDH